LQRGFTVHDRPVSRRSIRRFGLPAGRPVLMLSACLLCVASACLPLAAIAAGDGHAAHDDIGYVPTPSTDPAEFRGDLAIWSFAVFVLLAGLLAKFAWKPILEGLDKRERGIADTIAATRAANEEAKSMLASYERRLAEASEEVRGMLEEARRDAEATKQTIVAEARKAADDEQARAKREIGLATDDALSRIAERAGELAVDVAGKFLREKLSTDDHQRLVRDSVASIRSTPSVN
jgi:F-type H+-transporting ATPase subunit b